MESGEGTRKRTGTAEVGETSPPEPLWVRPLPGRRGVTVLLTLSSGPRVRAVAAAGGGGPGGCVPDTLLPRPLLSAEAREAPSRPVRRSLSCPRPLIWKGCEAGFLLFLCLAVFSRPSRRSLQETSARTPRPARCFRGTVFSCRPAAPGPHSVRFAVWSGCGLLPFRTGRGNHGQTVVVVFKELCQS